MEKVILLVEDNEDHAELMLNVLEDGTLADKIFWVKDGQEAIDFMYKKGRYQDARCPSLIILDINLPKVNGIEVLKEIKTIESFKLIPVVMLTTSDRKDEMAECYRLGSNSFITEPVKFGDYFEKIRSMGEYWLKINNTINSNGDFLS